MADQKLCPNGHKLPRKGKNGVACAVVYCADVPVEVKRKKPRGKRSMSRHEGDEVQVARSKERIRKLKNVQADLPAEQRVEISSLVPSDALPLDGKETPEEYAAAKEEMDASREELARGNAALQVRRRAIPVPAGLTGGDADEWVAKELANVAPLAVAELKHQLLFSVSQDKRRLAAQDLLDRAGHGKKDNSNTNAGPVIVVNMPGAVPWSQAGAKPVQVVESKPATRSIPERVPGPLPFTVVPTQE